VKTASKRKVSAKIARRTRHIAPQRALATIKAAPPTVSEAIEQVLLTGNLISLTVEQRLEYYKKVCESLGLNPLTRPFDYIAFDGKLQLYARKDCTEQLRKLHGIAIIEASGNKEDGLYVVQVKAQDRHGRTDTGTGAVVIEGLKGINLANAIMKAETKAKRRATLSMAGLGFLDESELDTVGDYGTLTPGGRVMEITQPTLPEPENPHLKAYLDRLAPEDRKREVEALEKLVPAQKEVATKIIANAEAKKAPKADTSPGLWYKFHPESGMYEVDGLQSDKTNNKDLLGPLFNKTARCILCKPEQLGKLISQLEDRKVSFKEIAEMSREPGE
jgi:hypothetical protein